MENFKQPMKNEFDRSDLGVLHHFLGLEVSQGKARIFVYQNKYVQGVFDKFKIGE